MPSTKVTIMMTDKASPMDIFTLPLPDHVKKADNAVKQIMTPTAIQKYVSGSNPRDFTLCKSIAPAHNCKKENSLPRINVNIFKISPLFFSKNKNLKWTYLSHFPFYLLYSFTRQSQHFETFWKFFLLTFL